MIEIVTMMLMMLTTTTMTKMMVVAVMAAVMMVVGLSGGGCKKEESARGVKQTRSRDMHLERPCSQCPAQVQVTVGVWISRLHV